MRDALNYARARLDADRGRVEFVHADYRELASVLQTRGVMSVAGVLADLACRRGNSTTRRAGSVSRKRPLDMRMDTSRVPRSPSGWRPWMTETLADVIWTFGEERRSRRVARAIVAARDRGELDSTIALAAAVRRGVGGGWQRIDPATGRFRRCGFG
jgi:16S rRNA (cytosine1402-N4)-methyltransferase